MRRTLTARAQTRVQARTQGQSQRRQRARRHQRAQTALKRSALSERALNPRPRIIVKRGEHGVSNSRAPKSEVKLKITQVLQIHAPTHVQIHAQARGLNRARVKKSRAASQRLTPTRERSWRLRSYRHGVTRYDAGVASRALERETLKRAPVSD